MHDFPALLMANSPVILEYAFMFVAYFLVFLFKGKVTATKKNIDIAFLQFAQKFAANETTTKEELDTSKAQYNSAVNLVSDLQRRIRRLEETVEILLGDDIDVDVNVDANVDEEVQNDI